MIDNFAIGLTHLLMALAAYRLLTRADLDQDSPVASPKGLGDSADDLAIKNQGQKQGARHV